MMPMLFANLRPGNPTSRRLLAGALATLLAAAIGFAAWNFFIRDPRRLQLALTSLEHNREQREEAYAWLVQHSDPADRVTAYEDAVLYLYTDRQGLRPIAFLPESGYMGDLDYLSRDLVHLTDAAHYVEARFWLATDDDFYEETYSDIIRGRLREIESVLPVVFHSTDGSVRILDASCVVDTQVSACSAASKILFPQSATRPMSKRELGR